MCIWTAGFYSSPPPRFGAQQTSPAADEAKQALIGRVQEYYKLLQDKKFRQAEKRLVAEESKEDYYAGKKPDIKGFDIARVEVGA